MSRTRLYLNTIEQNKIVLTVALLLALLLVSCSNDGEQQPTPVLSNISPSAVTVGSSATTLKINGSGFAEQSIVRANSLALDTTYISANELSAFLPAGLLATAGVLNLSVSQPEFETRALASLPLTIVAPGVVSPTNHTQVAAYAITVPRDAQVAVAFEAPGQPVRHTWVRPTPAGGGEVSILVAGMVPFTTYQLRAIIEFPDGATFIDAVKPFTTGGLTPERTPDISVTQSDVLLPNPGVQLWNLNGRGETNKVQAVITDLGGNVIWFHDELTFGPWPMRLLPNGNFLVNDSAFTANASSVKEIDLVGHTIRQIDSLQINDKLIEQGLEPVADFIHHDVIVLPNGNWMLLTSFPQVFTDLVGFEGQKIGVQIDALVELDENLDPVWIWSALDHLDINRHPFSDPDPPNLWTHGNAVVYAPADGNLLLSLRQQHWVVKIDYQDGHGTGEVLWRLGLEGDFNLLNAGPEGWQYAQHFPFILDQHSDVFRLALWDNGNFRVVGDQETGGACNRSAGVDCYSRAVIYEIDEPSSTVRIIWEDILDFFSPFIGIVFHLNNCTRVR